MNRRQQNKYIKRNIPCARKWWEIPPKYITDEREREKYNKLK